MADFRFTLITWTNVVDPHNIFGKTSTSEDGNSDGAGPGKTISFNSAGDVHIYTAEGDYPDDNGADITQPVQLKDGNGTQYNFVAGDEVEADFEIIFRDMQSGYYYRVTFIAIENHPVGVVVSPAWNASTGTYVSGAAGIYVPGTVLTAVDGDVLDGTPNYQNFVTDTNYHDSDYIGNDAKLTPTNFPTIVGDGWVEGTAANDLIDANYIEPLVYGNDRVDANDARLPGRVGNDDNIRAGAGNDTVFAAAGHDIVYGGIGNDQIYGGVGNDTLYGDGGDDTLYGGAGQDSLLGGGGDDSLLGEDENDTLDGGIGNDTLIGGAGDDSLIGGEDNDWLIGDVIGQTEGGNDTIDAGIGNDYAEAGGGNDLVYGGAGLDTLYGGDGNDTIDGGADADTIYGGAGNDSILGGTGDDLLFGDGGNDTLVAGGGNDTLTGGAGDDLFVISGPSTNTVTITDFGFGETNGNNGQSNDNDYLDLSSYYNDHLAQYNSTYGTNFTNPLAALRHDASDGELDFVAVRGGPRVLIQSASPDVFDTEHTGVTCFSRGTHIQTERGEVAVENLVVGDRVLTFDHGYQPIRWLGSRLIGGGELAVTPKLRPIRIRAGALGVGLPCYDLVVSPQHRLMVSSKIVENMFGERAALIAAKQLLGVEGVEVVEDGGDVEYFHLMLDRHEIIFAETAPTESLYVGEMALSMLGDEAREEIFTLFPELRHREFGRLVPSARMILPAKAGRKLAQRHGKNAVDLMERNFLMQIGQVPA